MWLCFDWDWQLQLLCRVSVCSFAIQALLPESLLSKDLTIWRLCAGPSWQLQWLFQRPSLLFKATTELEIILHAFFPVSFVGCCSISVHLARCWMSHWHAFLSGHLAARLPWTSIDRAGYFSQSLVHFMCPGVRVELSRSLHNARQLDQQEQLLLYWPSTVF